MSQKRKLLIQSGVVVVLILGSVLILLFAQSKREQFIHPIRLKEGTIGHRSKQPVLFRYAVQIHERDGNILFFRSVGDFLAHIKKNNYRFHRAFMMDHHLSRDFKSEKWINVRVGYFIKTTLKTPDGSGWIGLINKESAQFYLKDITPKSKMYTMIDLIRAGRQNIKLK